MHRALAVTALAAALVGVATVAVSAEPDPAAARKYEHALMRTLGSQMMAIGMITSGKAGSADDLLGHATVLYETAKIVPHAFPKGIGVGQVDDSRVLAKVWEDAAGFDAAAKALVDASATLVKIAKKKDVEGVKAQLEKVGAACGGCHDAYRGPEEEEHEEHHD